MEFIETMKSSNLVWLILSLCSIISVPLAIYFGRKSLSQKIIYAVLSSNEIITNNQPNISKVKILYDNEAVDNLTVTQLTFWNKTFTTINKTDIIDAEPLSIFTNSGKILDVSVLKGSKSSNRINVFLTSEKSANITFDYLDKKEGGIIQVIHTGNQNSINISQKIKGGKVKVQKFSEKAFVICLITSGISCIPLLYLLNSSTNPVFSVIISFVLYGIIILILVLLFKYIYIDYVPKNCKRKLFHKSSDSN